MSHIFSAKALTKGMCAQPVHVMYVIVILSCLYIHYVLQGSGKVIVSMDAIFGLPRKKAAGGSVRQPLHGDLFFEDQSQIDEYLNNATRAKSVSKVCHTIHCMLKIDHNWF